MELTKEQIQRIDSFLERLGCEYIDIRYEMVDHIASDIENKVDDFDAFFEKKEMRGKFLGYMMHQKKELEDTYIQQSKRQLFLNLWKITKQVSKSIFNLKILASILFSFIVFQQLIKYNIKYTVIFTAKISVIIGSFSTFFIWQQIKRIGKVRIVYSYYSIIAFLMYLAIYIPNIFNIYKSEYHNPFVANFHFILIVLNALILINFIKHKIQFKEKYNYLIQ